jgi:branched-chain amino acid transport system permease protein
MTSTQPDIAESQARQFRFSWTDSFLWAIRVMAIFIVVWGFVGTIALGMEGNGLTLDAWKQLIVSGLAQGSMYGLIALGYSMVYGVLGFINFAHGEVFMVGAVVGYFTADALEQVGLWESNFIIAIILVILASIASSTFTAVLIERIAYRPLRRSPRLIPLITSIGVSFFLQNAVLLLIGPAVRSYPSAPDWLREQRNILGFQVSGTIVAVVVIAAVSMVGLWLFVERSAIGKAMRAVAEDKEIAALMGINVDRVIVITFAVGGAMAGVGAILWGLLFRGVSYITGFLPGIKAFTAAVLGGIGNIVGAFFGGILLGLFEGIGPNVVLRGLAWQVPTALGITLIIAGGVVVAAARALKRHGMVVVGAAAVLLGVAGVLGWSVEIPGLSQLKDVVAFTALVLVLIFKPAGLFGEQLGSEDRV